MTAPLAHEAGVVWHELECGSYAVDLPLWEELAEMTTGPILDLGCGTGRVALHLARRGRDVHGLDRDPGLLPTLKRRAAGLSVEAIEADAGAFALDTRFRLALAPMQLIQLFPGPDERLACLQCVADHLAPNGRAAFAIVESMPAPVDAPPPLPDAREVGGWVYSSLPIETIVDAEQIRVRRLRQVVSPAGELSEALDEVVLSRLGAAALEAEAKEAGLKAAERRPIPATEAHVGSTAVLFEREA